ncbi:exopolyphosphatase [Aquincola tertiaricarbonis]|uniref:Exopolyphosphatase n=1 Tax=Aquincola tertiaricarbonis TaxID=391953 RepID=A0ABY4SHL5_AQUTE|nr:exopolyphosphatase [Aquincola tertiaricarbonis]URI10820.1 exopolyphosphatase [Aquincola tertiaricarbonis]
MASHDNAGMDLQRTLTSGPLAAIDMGSNSFRLEIGQMQHGRYRRIDYLKETVRLGAGLDADGLLTEPAAQRGLACLQRFAKRLQGFEVAQVRAVATQTLREASNRDAFLARAQEALGKPIEVISGREEARLIYAGVAHLQPSDAPRLVIDIGGRSTEMILGTGRLPTTAESFRVGSVSLSMRHFPDGRLTEAGFREAQIAAGAEFEEGLDAFAPRLWTEALGSSGTAGAVSQLLAASRVTDGSITPKGLRWLIQQCISAGHIDKLDLPGLKEDRRAVIAGGLAILYTLAAHFRIEHLQPARGALRQGVIIDLYDRVHAPRDGQHGDVRDHSVRELQKRFQVDVAQAERVRVVALALYRQLAPQADADAVRELGWACDLHELGMMVSHHDHHRHSAYLLSHVDAPGFSQNQQRRIADLVLGQRGGLRKIEAALANEGFAWQVVALRLAAIECHARGAFAGHAIDIERHGRGATIQLPADWASSNPRTLYLLQEEAAAWQRNGAVDLKVAG